MKSRNSVYSCKTEKINGIDVLTEITVNLNIKLNGSLRFKVVYAPVVFVVNTTKVNIQEVLSAEYYKPSEDATEQKREYIMNTDIYNKFYSGAILRDEPLGSIKGKLVVEYGQSTFFKASVYNGNAFVGYALDQKSTLTSVNTAYSNSDLSKYITNAIGFASDTIYKELNFNEATTSGQEKSVVVESEGTSTSYGTYNYAVMQKVTSATDIADTEQVTFMSTNSIYSDSTNKNKIIFEKNSQSNNNIMLFDITRDVKLYIFYTAISYNLEIDIAVTDKGIAKGNDLVKQGGASEGTLTPYIAYECIEDKYVQDANGNYTEFVNPASQITISDIVNSNINDKKDDGTDDGVSSYDKVTFIEDGKEFAQQKVDYGKDIIFKYCLGTDVVKNDRLVYTAFDNYGRIIISDVDGHDNNLHYRTVNLSPIFNTAINFDLSKKIGFLVYNSVNDGGNEHIYAPSLRRYKEDPESSSVPIKYVTQSGAIYDSNPNNPNDEVAIKIYKNASGKLYAYLKAKPLEYLINVNANGRDENGNAKAYEKMESKEIYYYELIPYTVYPIYAEYTNNLLEESYNNSKELTIAESIFTTKNSNISISKASSTAIENSYLKADTAITSNATVASNNKYIYSILNFEFEEGTNVINEVSVKLDAGNKPIANHIYTTDISTTDTHDYAIYPYEFKDTDGQIYKFAVVTNLFNPKNLKNPIDETNSKWWMVYTTKYIDSVLNNKSNENKSNKQAMEAILVMKTDIDANITKNVTYNISSQGINYNIQNYTDFVDFSNASGISLKQNLFKLSIGNELTFDSSDFKYQTNSNTIEKDLISGKIYTAKLKSNAEGGNAFADLTSSYNYDMKLKYTKNGDGTYFLSISISITLFSDETGSLPSVKIIQCKELETSANSNIMAVGKIVDYSYSPSSINKDGVYDPGAIGTDTIYKPSGDYEKVGTKAARVAKTNDSFYIDNLNDMEGFFTNLYVGEQKTRENPNMNAKVTLLYSQKLKTLESKVSVSNKEAKDNYVNTLKEFSLANTGDSLLVENPLLNKLCVDNILNPMISSKEYINKALPDLSVGDDYNKSKDPLVESPMYEDIYSRFGLVIEHYYVYVVKDAYPIISILDWLSGQNNNGQFNITNMSDVALANDMKNYILSYDPENFKMTSNYTLSTDGKLPEYIFTKRTDTQHQSKVFFAYSDLYSLINKYKSNLYYAGYTTAFLPSPSQNGGQYLRLRKIDVLNSAIHGNDANFLNLNFSQNDLIISSIQIRELYQKQINSSGFFFDKPWNANHAYSYCDFAKSEITVKNGASPGCFVASLNAAEMSDTIAGTENQSSRLKDQSPENTALQFWRLGDSYTGNYSTLIGSALALSNDGFNASNNEKIIVSVFTIHSIKPFDTDITHYREKQETYDRVKTAQYNYDPKTWNGIVTVIGDFLFPGGFQLVKGIIEGKSIAEIASNVANSLGKALLDRCTFGMFSVVSGLITICSDGNAKSYYTNLLQS